MGKEEDKNALRKLLELLILEEFETFGVCGELRILSKLRLIAVLGNGWVEPQGYKYFERVLLYKSLLPEMLWTEVIKRISEIMDSSYWLNPLSHYYEWDEARNKVLARFKKKGAGVYVVSTNDYEDILYCTHPIGAYEFNSIRDTALAYLADWLDLLMKNKADIFTEELLSKFYDTERGHFKGAFWLPESEDLREELYQTLFTCREFDLNLEEDEELNESGEDKCLE